jgi:hypothetical protein
LSVLRRSDPLLPIAAEHIDAATVERCLRAGGAIEPGVRVTRVEVDLDFGLDALGGHRRGRYSHP